jgi:two-component system OmpR family sensor kinase/two-component system sensor histidine kinase BaeS
MRLRLFLSFSLVVVLTTVAILVLVGLNTAQEIRQFADQGGFAGSERLVAELEDYYGRNLGWNNVDRVFRRGPGGPGFGQEGQGKVSDKDGNVIYSAQSTKPGEVLSKDQLEHAIHLKDSGGETIGYFVPAGGLPPRGQIGDSLIDRLNRAVLVATIVGGGASLVLAFGLTYSLMRPIRDLTRASKALAEGDMSHRVAVRGDGDIADLAHTFNDMAGSLESAETRRKALTADIAHELRTPIAVQRANLEALIDGIYPLDLDNLEPILAQSHLLEHLVEDLRTLALADSGEIKLDLVKVSPNALIARTAQQFATQSRTKKLGIDLDLDVAETAIPHDPIRLEQVLFNLLSNAIRHTPESGQIKLISRIDPDTKKYQIRVHDSGPGIPGDQLDRIFERFYRADTGRSRESGGTGLGLAIARQLVRAHGGSISATNHPDGGAQIVVTLNT